MIIPIVLIGFVLYGVFTFNRLVALRQQVENAFGQIDVQLKRRYDLIPQLVETVKGSMKHEQETLDRVIAARNSALEARSLPERTVAENSMQQAVTGLFAISEAYPELRANQNMIQLQEELRSTENKISFARQYYNDVVTAYNAKVQSFPANLIAGAQFRPRDYFELDDPSQRRPVQVSF